ncbi:MAG: TetR/AcrR family transcriptional regulator [Segniliparus sp.]|uniref:TetR/AcrR family transcriptional regulator n=1 Tax=Segniliparus sp. TaxID=2804064 RepID=UPI003F4045F4
MPSSDSDSAVLSPRARRGRPRSETAKAAILAAAYDLVVDHGMAQVTVDDIAARASVGKQTIYRWWPSKAELVLDALEERAKTEIDTLETASVAAFLARVFVGACGVRLALKSLIAAAQSDEALGEAVKARLIEPRRAALRRCLERAGVPKVRREALVLAIYGAMWYRLLLDEPLDDALVAELARLTV